MRKGGQRWNQRANSDSNAIKLWLRLRRTRSNLKTEFERCFTVFLKIRDSTLASS